MITFKVTGTLKALAALKTVDEIYAAKYEKALSEVGKYILKESQKVVPYDTGALHDTGKTENVGGKGWKADQIVSYGSKDVVYALWQHESIDYKHTPPRRRKYLEYTIRDRFNEMSRIVKRVFNTK